MQERKITSVFLGIPLPERYCEDYRHLLGELKEIDPNLEMAESETPNVTLYYLKAEADEKRKDILARLGAIFHFLKGLETIKES